jgi:tetratricopeptide (TPR) repeat protein
VLDSGAERVRLQLADQPQLRGAFLRTLAGVYESLGLLPQAQPLADESLALASSPRERALSLFTLGRLRNAQGQYAKASELMQSALALVDAGSAELSPDALADLLNRYGISERLQRHLDTSEQLHMRELVVRLGAHGAADSVTGRAYYALAYVRYMRNDFLSAELLLRRTIEIYQRRFGDDYSGLAGPTRTLADLLDEQGRHADAEPLYLRSLAITESVYGPDHPNVALQANNLGVSYYLQDRLDEALPYLERSLAINRKRLPADHPELGNPQLNMGLVYLKQHKYAEAEARFRATLALWEGRVPADDPNLAWVWWGLGETYLQTGKPAQAEPWLARAYAQRVATQSPDHRDLLQAKTSLEAARAALSTPAPAPH